MLYIMQGTLEKMWDYLGREGVGWTCGKGRLPPSSSLKQLKGCLSPQTAVSKVSVEHSEEFHECVGMHDRCSALC